MARKFWTANFVDMLNLKISSREALPPKHLAQFVVDMNAPLVLTPFYNQRSLGSHNLIIHPR